MEYSKKSLDFQIYKNIKYLNFILHSLFTIYLFNNLTISLLQYYMATVVLLADGLVFKIFSEDFENFYLKKLKLLKFLDVFVLFGYYFILGGERNNYSILIFLPSLISFIYLELEDFLWTNFSTILLFVLLQFSFFPFVGQINYIEPMYFVVGYLMLGLILSKLKQNELQDLFENYERLSQLKPMVSILSHRIGTPLNILKLKIDRIKRGRFNEDEIDDLVYAQNEVEKIVSNLRNSVINFENINELDLVNLKECIKTLNEGDLIEFNLESDNDIWVLGHRAIILNSLKDLLKNSREAGSSKVTIQLSTSGPRAILIIADNGEGFNKEFMHSGPKAFFSTKGNNNLGISLFNIKNYFNSIGSNIDFENSDIGAKIVIDFKRVEE